MKELEILTQQESRAIIALRQLPDAMGVNEELPRLYKTLDDCRTGGLELLRTQRLLTERIDKLETKWRAVPENPVEHVKSLFGDE